MFVNDLETFVEKIMAEKKLPVLAADVKQEMKEDLIERMEKLISAEILVNIPSEHLASFESVLESGDSVEIQNFCQRNVPNIQSIVAGALLRARSAYLTGGM